MIMIIMIMIYRSRTVNSVFDFTALILFLFACLFFHFLCYFCCNDEYNWHVWWILFT